MSDNDDYQPDYSQYNEDSVPPPEREIKHTHAGRPDLDYDDTPVGPAEGVEYIHEEHHHEQNEEQQHQSHHHHRHKEQEEEEN